MSNEVKYGELQGVDASIEISLFEYGIACQYAEDGSEVRFWYGIELGEDECYSKFDWGWFKADTDPGKEFNWADFEDVASCHGCTVDELLDNPLEQVVYSLLSYYGPQNVFGESYGSGFEFDPETETFSYVGS